ncbi:MAG: transporter substrate-binding domain-containing protein [Chloroflexi bacterium]|nr:transporter substrate-binding domain-containing protein [Chloroflexota bacterium]MCL5273710.1 transporter substrate-binding domain-containing protein [Chloroflexota bacterium]
MKSFRWIGLLAVAATVIAGCTAPAAPTASPAPAPTSAPAATAAPKATEAPTAAAAPTATTAASNSTSSLPDLKGRTVTVAIEDAYLPFNYIRLDNGKPEGWDYDTLAELCKRLNCKVSFKEIAWDNMIAAVAGGQFDMAADGITITDERAKVVDFSEGYIAVDQRVLVRKDETRFKTVDELKSGTYKVATQKGTTNYDEAVKLVGESRVTAFDTFGDAVQALISKDADAVVIDDTAGQGYVGVNADKVVLLDGALIGQQLGFIYPKGSDLVKPFNAAIEAIKSDGTLNKLNEKWFGPSFKMTYDEVKPGPTAAPTATPGK